MRRRPNTFLSTVGSCTAHGGGVHVCLLVSRCSGFAGAVLSACNARFCEGTARNRNFVHNFFGIVGSTAAKAKTTLRQLFVAKIDPIAVSSIADNFGVKAGVAASP